MERIIGQEIARILLSREPIGTPYKNLVCRPEEGTLVVDDNRVLCV